ncbi:unnamed protein product [Caenorhabditis angaria]|uniref:Uncharacterized protein n=1 Tax=Caenorhabditis angaria TaxID=860376 RepID=A0A9P1MZZ3_9PELO|nr:unnamed protein product [Caenorhabditis angaria]
MLLLPNESCISTKPWTVIVFTDGLSLSSLPLYFLTFYILIFKCPPVFNKYRILLLRHLVCCFFMEFNMTIIWQLIIIMPLNTLCANSIAYNFPKMVFYIQIHMMLFTAITIFDLSDYRLKVVKTGSQEKLVKRINFFKYFTYFSFSITMSFLYISYGSITNEKSYKLRVQQKFGNLPDFVWCDNCIFFDDSSNIIIIFFISGMISVTLAFFYCIITAYASFSALNEMKKSFSVKTLEVQKNFLISLLIMVYSSLEWEFREFQQNNTVFQNAIHLLFIAIPCLIFFIGCFSSISYDLMFISYVCVSLITQHGSASTLILLTTNKALRNVIKSFWK